MMDLSHYGPIGPRQFMKDFLSFIREQGVIGLAVGFLLGGAVSKLVTALISDIINPVLGLLLGAAGNLKDASWSIGRTEIMWGDFVANLLDFAVIAAVVYFTVRVLGLDKLDIKKHSQKSIKLKP